jgi:uncharacterized protein YbaR (Trm112 family)
MHRKLLKILACPVCKGALEYHHESNKMICKNDRIEFPINNEVPVLLEMDAKKLRNMESGCNDD